jgi:hypothetical protein
MNHASRSPATAVAPEDILVPGEERAFGALWIDMCQWRLRRGFLSWIKTSRFLLAPTQR